MFILMGWQVDSKETFIKQLKGNSIVANELKAIGADVVKDMLMLKKKDEESYNKVKEVIDTSRQTAKRYLYITDKLIKENT